MDTLTVTQATLPVNLEWTTNQPVNLQMQVIGGAPWAEGTATMVSDAPQIAALTATITADGDDALLLITSNGQPVDLAEGTYTYRLVANNGIVRISGLATPQQKTTICTDQQGKTIICRNNRSRHPVANQMVPATVPKDANVYWTWGYDLSDYSTFGYSHRRRYTLPNQLNAVKGISHITGLAVRLNSFHPVNDPDFTVFLTLQPWKTPQYHNPEVPIQLATYNNDTYWSSHSPLWSASWKNPGGGNASVDKVESGQWRAWELDIPIDNPQYAKIFLQFMQSEELEKETSLTYTLFGKIDPMY